MPTYDYECDACGHTFEHWQTMTSNRLRKCPGCGLKKLRRLIGSGSGVIFKGAGFYETDYKKKRGGRPKDEAGAESSKGDEPAKKDAQGDTPTPADGTAAKPKKAAKTKKANEAKKD